MKRCAAPVVAVLAFLALPAAARALQERTVIFQGNIQCTGGGDRPQLLVVSRRAVNWPTTSSAPTGYFSLQVPRSAVETDILDYKAGTLYLVADVRSASGKDTVVTLKPRFGPRDVLGQRFDRDRYLALHDLRIDLRCDSIAPMDPDVPVEDMAERARRALVQQDLPFDEGVDLKSAGFLSSAGGATGSAVRTIGNLVNRFLFRGAFFPPVMVPFEDPPVYDFVEFYSDTVRVEMQNRSLQSVPLWSQSNSLGFSFAPSRNLDASPMFNPAGMPLANRPQGSFQFDDEGYVTGSILAPVTHRLSVGAAFYRHHVPQIRYCELIDPTSVVIIDPDFDGPRSAMTDEDVCIPRSEASFAMSNEDDRGLYAGGLDRTLGSAVSVRLPAMESRLGLDERVGVLSAGWIVNPTFALGASAKYVFRAGQSVAGIRRSLRRVVMLDGSRQPARSLGSAIVQDTFSTEGLDLDISALALLSRLRVGVTVMNVAGTRVGAPDGSRINTRSLGIGLGFEVSRFDLGMDTRVPATGPLEYATGLSFALPWSMDLRVGYANDHTRAAGLTFRNATYTFVNGGPAGKRHLSGFRLRF